MMVVDLSSDDRNKLSELDSRLFGFLKISKKVHNEKQAIIRKGISYYDHKIDLLQKDVGKVDETILSSIYCTLGHLHLLSEDFFKALSAYQMFYRYRKHDHWKNSPFLYGLGLVYFHYNLHHLAVKAFLTLLYVDSSFACSNEVHLRLGLIYKDLKDFSASLRHFRLALNDSSPCTLPKQEIKFYIAHVQESQGHLAQAKETYEQLLQGNVSSPVKVSVLCQLGWMYHASVDDKRTRENSAIRYLQEALELDRSNGQTWYLLGRCLSGSGRVHDAFAAYRNSIDKSDAGADTWCSIGVLYQQQSQYMDALQAYICAIQLDNNHWAAWSDLGVLYETIRQPRDALTCYTIAAKIKGCAELANIEERIDVLQKHLARIPILQLHAAPKELPSVEEAWNLPIPAELTARQGQQPKDASSTDSKPATESDPKAEGKETKPPSHQMSAQQLQMLAVLQANVANLSPQQKQLLTQLQQMYYAHQQGLQSTSSSQVSQTGQVGPGPSATVPKSEPRDDDWTKTNSVNDGDINAILQNPDLTSSLADDLLTQLSDKILKKGGKSPLERKANGEPRLSIDMKAAAIIGACKGLGNSGVSSSVLLSKPPEPPRKPPRLSREFLNPATPAIVLEGKKDAFSTELESFCYSQPVVVVRGLSTALKLDLGLFSTKTLTEANPDTLVEVRSQVHQNINENLDSRGKSVWGCESSKSYTTILKYAQYQAASFQESLHEEQERVKAIRNGELSEQQIQQSVQKTNRLIKYGTNIDLSDPKKWEPQLRELEKLPKCFKLVAACNMLSHVGHAVPGMNSIHLHMKVPGCRTTGRQEPNNFCSINVNIGPGDNEWFCVPFEYWGEVHRLCNEKGVNFLRGHWWPQVDQLLANDIPVHRVIQKPGDLVFIGPGTIYWVQAVGWCNNISWNVGPFTAHQYRLAMERHEWNKLQGFKSAIPMMNLTWNIARNVRIADEALFSLVKKTLLRSLKYCQMTLDFVHSLGMTVNYHGKKETDHSHYCVACEVEVFNLLFVSQQGSRHVVHCQDCARKLSPTLDGIHVLNEFHLHELMSVYDQFQFKSPGEGQIIYRPKLR